MEKTLRVYRDGAEIGTIGEDGERITFKYSEAWRKSPGSTPIAPHIPLDKDCHEGPNVEAFFENLLPEGDVRAAICAHFQISPGNTFALLEKLGGDTAGVFSIMPADAAPSAPPQYVPIDAAVIGDWIRKHKETPFSLQGEKARVSLSGAQEKILLFALSDGKFGLPIGDAPSSHILKPNIRYRSDTPFSALNEAFTMKLAEEIDMDVAKVVYRPDMGGLLVERYDRLRNEDGRLKRLAQSDVCQILGIPSQKKYEAEGGPSLKQCIDAVAGQSSQPAVDVKRLIEWVAYNLIAGNMDGHAKNISLLTDQNGTRLTPFYDLMCTRIYPSLSKRLAFKIGGENRPEWLMARHWDRLAQEMGFRPSFVRGIASDVAQRVYSAIPSVQTTLGATGDEKSFIESIATLIAANAKTMMTRLDGNQSDADSSRELPDDTQKDIQSWIENKKEKKPGPSPSGVGKRK